MSVPFDPDGAGVMTNILEQISVFGTSSSPRAPEHLIVEPDVVGELIADAIRYGMFLVVTAPEIHDELRERAADPDSYVQRLISEQALQDTAAQWHDAQP